MFLPRRPFLIKRNKRKIETLIIVFGLLRPQLWDVFVGAPHALRSCSQRDSCACRHSDVGHRTAAHTDNGNLLDETKGQLQWNLR